MSGGTAGLGPVPLTPPLFHTLQSRLARWQSGYLDLSHLGLHGSALTPVLVAAAGALMSPLVTAEHPLVTAEHPVRGLSLRCGSLEAAPFGRFCAQISPRWCARKASA